MAKKSVGEKELVLTRVFDAPREKVWKAWTEPEQFKKWWGPEGFICPIAEMDVRVGGKYFACMEGVEGQWAGARNYSTGIYKEIVPMERLVTTDSFADKDGNPIPASQSGIPGMENWPDETTLTVTFEDAGEGKTKMTIKHGPLPVGAMFDNTNLGWNSSLNKLDASLK